MGSMPRAAERARVTQPGDAISPSQSNFDGSDDGSGPSEVTRQKTIPVGSFPPNEFGPYDASGSHGRTPKRCAACSDTRKKPPIARKPISTRPAGVVRKG